MSNEPRYTWALALCGLLIVAPRSVGATPITVDHIDTSGRRWASLVETANVSWNQLNIACSTDGLTPCANNDGLLETTGWIWATRDQVRALFVDLGVPAAGLADYIHNESGSTWAPAATPSAFDPTLGPTSSGNYIDGWTSTPALAGQAYRASIFDSFSSLPDQARLDTAPPTSTSLYSIGAWLFMPVEADPPAPVPEPATLTLLGLGLAGLAARRGRRR